MDTGRRCTCRQGFTDRGFNFTQRVKNVDTVTARVLWERDETDLVDAHLIDNPNARLAVVEVAGNVFAAKVLGRADRAPPS
jgi:hypothetical protein